MNDNEKELLNDCIESLNYWRRKGDDIINEKHIKFLESLY